MVQCIKCGSSSFLFTHDCGLCENCGALVPWADLLAYVALTEPKTEEVIYYYEEPISPISPELDQIDQVGTEFIAL
jgi:hypothetical protein